MIEFKTVKGDVLYTVEAENQRSAILQLVKNRANLKGVYLRCSVLRGLDFRGADFSGADLRGVNLDFSCWTLACKTLHAVIDDRVRIQLLFHAAKPKGDVVDEDLRALLNSELYKKVANKFHRAQECGTY